MYRFRFPRIGSMAPTTPTEETINFIDEIQHAAKCIRDLSEERDELRARMHMADNDVMVSPLASINDPTIPLDQRLYIAFDPGPHTGWVVATHDLEFFLYGESTLPSIVAHSLHGLLARMTSFHRISSTIIIESFTLTSRPKDPKQATITLHQIGALRHVAARFGMEPVMQLPNTRKMTPTKALRSAGLWPVAQEHAQSAARHLGAYLITQGTLKP